MLFIPGLKSQVSFNQDQNQYNTGSSCIIFSKANWNTIKWNKKGKRREVKQLFNDRKGEQKIKDIYK